MGLSTGTLRDGLNALRLQLCGLDGKPLAALSREGIRRVVETAVTDGGLKTLRGRYYLTESKPLTRVSLCRVRRQVRRGFFTKVRR